MKRFIIFAILICLVGFSVFAQEENVVNIFKMPSARYAGMGGTHITNTDGAGALLNNPAGLVGKKEFGILEISASVAAPFDKIGDIQDSLDTLTASDDFETAQIQDLYDSITDEEGRMHVGANIGGPISLTIVGGGFGFGLFTGAGVDAAFNSGTVKVLADVNAQVNLGYGHRFIDTERHDLDAGVGINAFYRVHSEMRLSIDDIANIDDFDIPLQGIFGLGLDLGVQYTYNDRLHVALAANNLISYARITDVADDFGLAAEGHVKAKDLNGSSYRGLNIGMDYQLLKKTAGILDLTLMADYRDILDLFSDLPRNPILNIGLGAELGIFDHIFVRAGMTDMLPSLGLGFDLFAFKLNFAAYGKELGLDPGVQSVFCMDLGILFRW
jgi:hypothetical protein